VFPLRDNIPLSRLPVVTIAIVVINVVAYLLEIRHGGSFFGGPSDQTAVRFGAIPYEITHPGDHCELLTHSLPAGTVNAVACQGQPGVSGTPAPQPATWLTVFTSMFLHGGFLHLAGNMLFLWVFGNNVEDAMGHGRFVVFYVLCGLAAVLAQVLPNPGSIVPMIGASGAISGVLGAYMLLYPRARVLLGLPLGFLIVSLGRFPAVWVLAAWFVMQLFMGGVSLSRQAGADTGGIAFSAHVGGFVAGLLLVTLFKRRDVPLWRQY
jgi:membrane associated rhomboid family serine protease